VADGALRGVAGRPMILKRFVKNISEEAVFQKRPPAKRPDWVEVAELHYASGTSAEEVVVRDAATLAWVVNLGCVDLNPHPVQALPDARVSTPVEWDEVRDLRPEAFTLTTVPARFDEIGDPWVGMDASSGSLLALLDLAESMGPPEKPPKGTGRRQSTMPLI